MKVELTIPFNLPYMTGRELDYIAEAHKVGHLSGDGPFTTRCHAWLRERTGATSALLTTSCTSALEISALLAEIGEGDEVIMPSFTFVSTANAFVLRGARPVFVDVRPDTLNLDENLIESTITSRTRAIVPVHYAGVSCEMDTINRIAEKHGLLVIEDAAQGIMSSYKGRPLGTLGDIGALSFHETKNIIAGEGGALLLRDSTYVQRAEIIREKGTDRARFFRGEVDKYTWCDKGSSYLPSELIAAFLMAQMEEADSITARRHDIWSRYHEAFESMENEGTVRRPVIPSECHHNAHMYYLLMPSLEDRTRYLAHMRSLGILPVFHYVPLHSSPMGAKVGRAAGDLEVTTDISNRLVRLPLYVDLSESQQERVIDETRKFLTPA